MWSALFDYLWESQLNYFAITTHDTTKRYFTLLKIESKNVGRVTNNIEDFITEHIGEVQSFENGKDRFDFCVDGVKYSIFDYSAGVVVV